MNIHDCLTKSPEVAYTDFNLVKFNRITPNIVDSLCVLDFEESDGTKVSAFTSDITLLFNQERLSNVLGADGVRKFFDSFASRSASLSELRSKISDEDLARVCKSRYLQSPSEILSWSNYLNEHYQSLVNDIKSSVEVSSSDDVPSGNSDSSASN